MYTQIIDTYRHHKFGVQVVVRHGRARGVATEARMRAQMLWARTRLIEQGDDSVRDLNRYDVRTHDTETQVSLAANVHTW